MEKNRDANYALISLNDDSAIDDQNTTNSACSSPKRKITYETNDESPNFNINNYVQKYRLQILFILILIIGVFIAVQYLIIRQKDKTIQKLAQTAAQIECLKNKVNADFQQCDKYLKSKLKNPTAYKADIISQPHLTQLELKNFSELASLNSTFNDKIQFATKLYLNWKQNNQDLFELEYFRLNSQYDLNKQVSLKNLCIMSPFRNLLKHGSQNSSVHMFLHSLNSQNYSKYRVYMIDDGSIDNSTEYIIKELPKYPRLSNRITLLRNNESFGALANRDTVTRKYCNSGDVVLDIDGDDALIGKQVFNLFNRIYNQNPQAWFVYMNFVQIRGSDTGDGRTIQIDMKRAKKGPSKQIEPQLFNQYTYRTNLRIWSTSSLRTYLYDLYVKVPLNYLINYQKQQYEIKASDRYIMYALTELAGPNHTLFIEEYPYFYYQPNFDAWKKFDCTVFTIILSQAESRLLTPLKHLNSLDDKVETIKNYVVPIEIQKYYLERRQKLVECEYQQRDKKQQSII